MIEKIPGGYNGKILRVNLSNGTTKTEAIDEAFCRKHIGGAGFVSYYLLNELEPGIDPLGPDNKLIFAIGPLTGLPIPGSGRHCIGAKSPLTGGFAKSEVGEFWGAELKSAGFDGVIIEGASDKPVYLWIKNGEAEIRDAGHLWGQNTKETEEMIQKELEDKRVRMALIGPGGENKVLFSCVMQGAKDAAGRGGMGAVMGSKNLKAVAVRGTLKPNIVDPEGVKELRQWMLDNMDKVENFQKFGTGAAMDVFEQVGNLPTRNFRDGAFPEVNKISARTIKDTISVGMEGCYACPVKCKKVVEFRGSYYVDPAYGGPEYETLGALGSNCGVDDVNAVSMASALCNAYAIDTISTGGTIAFAMECFENGILTKEDTGGIDLQFGNADAMIKIVEMIAKREGIGDILAEGSARAAEKIGKGAEAYAIQVKKLEFPMHEPRLNKSLALGFMVNPHGADHCCNFIDFFARDSENPDIVTVPEAQKLGLPSAPFDDIGPDKVAIFRVVQLGKIVFDTLAVCQFLPYSLEQLAKATSAVTGWDITVEELLKASEKTLTLSRMFNLRQGLTAEDDKLPDRCFKPTTFGALKDTALDAEKLEKAKKHYYSLMGWDEKGVPQDEKLKELGVS